METINFDPLHHSVCTAYSDSNAFSSEPRNLEFRAGEAVSVQDAISIMTDALSESGGGYNEFEPDLLEYLEDKCTGIELARESSVCIYVHGAPKDTKLKWWANALKADECDWDGDLVRVWWD